MVWMASGVAQQTKRLDTAVTEVHAKTTIDFSAAGPHFKRQAGIFWAMIYLIGLIA